MIRTKRDSLERFIREQMEGPGACNNQFYCLDDENTQDGSEEVLNTTPGSIYTTAILFPQRKQAETIEGSNTSVLSEATLDEDSDYQESQDDNSSEDLDERTNRLGADEEDMYSISQRFPTTIGLSCCIDKNGEPISSSDIRLVVSGRYYTKIPNSHCTSVVVRVIDKGEFASFYSDYQGQLNPYFVFKEDGISLAADVTKCVSDVKNLILSINKELCYKVAERYGASIDAEYLQIGEN